MSDENHPIKASASTAGLITFIVLLTPDTVREKPVFIYILSIVPPFVVIIQNFLWKNSSRFKDYLVIRIEQWNIERKITKALLNPLINGDHKTQLQTEYSRAKTNTLISEMAKVQRSLAEPAQSVSTKQN